MILSQVFAIITVADGKHFIWDFHVNINTSSAGFTCSLAYFCSFKVMIYWVSKSEDKSLIIIDTTYVDIIEESGGLEFF